MWCGLVRYGHLGHVISSHFQNPGPNSFGFMMQWSWVGSMCCRGSLSCVLCWPPPHNHQQTCCLTHVLHSPCLPLNTYTVNAPAVPPQLTSGALESLHCISHVALKVCVPSTSTQGTWLRAAPWQLLSTSRYRAQQLAGIKGQCHASFDGKIHGAVLVTQPCTWCVCCNESIHTCL